MAGWRPGQVVAAGLGCALAGIVVASSTSVPALVASLGLLGLGVAAGTFPIRGRTTEEWTPVVVRFGLHRGEEMVSALSVKDASWFGADSGAGVIHDRRGDLIVVLVLESAGVSLLEPPAREQRVDGFVHALGTLAREGSVVDRVAWSTTATLDDGSRVARDLRRRGRDDVAVAWDSYRSLVTSLRGSGLRRDVYLSLRARSPSAAGTTSVIALLNEATTLQRAIEDAGHPPSRLLSARQLTEILEQHPGVTAEYDGDVTSLSVRATTTFSGVVAGGLHVVTWWVAEWPRHEVTSEFLAPVLLGQEGRSMAVVLEPVPPSVALRRAQVAKTSGAADDEVRRRGGFLMDRRREREARHVERRESELVDGHGSLRLCGFVSVVAADLPTLRDRVAATELAATQAGLSLRRLQGDHLRGYLATLPLAGGLP